MPAATSIIAGIALAAGTQQSRQARKQSKKARQLDEQRTKLQASKNAVESVREAQIARAQILQAGENQGVAGSSSVAGGVSSVQSTSAGNIGFANQLFQLQQSAGRLRESAAGFSSNAGTISAVGTLGASMDFTSAPKMTSGTKAAIAGHDFS